MNTQEILNKFNLNWQVEKKQLFFKGNKADWDPTNHYGIVRSDTDKCLGIATGSYTPVQNSEIVDTLLMAINGNNFDIQKAGTFKDGKKVFFLISSGELNIGNEKVNKLLYCHNSHDGSSGLTFGLANKILSCSNYFQRKISAIVRDIKGKSIFSQTLRHTPSITQKHEHLRIYFNSILESENMFYAKFNQMNSSTVNVNKGLIEKMTKYIFGTDIVPTTPRKTNIMKAYYDSIDLELQTKGYNLFGLFNGVTHYVNHSKSFPRRENGQLESVLCGSGNEMSNKAFDFCLAQLN